MIHTTLNNNKRSKTKPNLKPINTYAFAVSPK